MRHLDLFSGIGGFALAARWAEIETVAFCEIDKFCQKVLTKNFPNIPIHNDIKLLEPFDIDLITAGFPCQPFSLAGKRRGEKDERYLWPETIKVIKECKPDWVILENVPGIIPHVDLILEDLEAQDYAWKAFLIPASAIFAPHKRERLWIIANRDSLGSNNGVDHWQGRYLQEDKKWDLEKIQQEWSQFIPGTWKALTIGDWLQYNRKLCGRDDGLPNGLDRNKALGNSVVPQIPFIFMSIIKSILYINKT